MALASATVTGDMLTYIASSTTTAFRARHTRSRCAGVGHVGSLLGAAVSLTVSTQERGKYAA